MSFSPTSPRARATSPGNSFDDSPPAPTPARSGCSAMMRGARPSTTSTTRRPEPLDAVSVAMASASRSLPPASRRSEDQLAFSDAGNRVQSTRPAAIPTSLIPAPSNRAASSRSRVVPAATSSKPTPTIRRSGTGTGPLHAATAPSGAAASRARRLIRAGCSCPFPVMSSILPPPAGTGRSRPRCGRACSTSTRCRWPPSRAPRTSPRRSGW